jgi:ACS family hexuronate transporter-like MFS transporter
MGLFITGTLGFLWTWIWLRVYYTPDADPSVIANRNSVTIAAASPVRIRWVELFRYRQVWGLISAKFLSDSAWYFFIFWLPKYLADVRKLNIREIGYYAWIPYAFAGAGSFVGGWLSSHLIQRGFSVDRSRKISLGLSASLMPASLLIATSSLRFAILFFSLALFGHQFWSTIMQTLPADMFPPRIVASVAGLLGAAGSFGGMFFNYLVGQILGASHSYSPVFLISGLLHPAAFLIVLFAVKRIDQVA